MSYLPLTLLQFRGLIYLVKIVILNSLFNYMNRDKSNGKSPEHLDPNVLAKRHVEPYNFLGTLARYLLKFAITIVGYIPNLLISINMQT